MKLLTVEQTAILLMLGEKDAMRTLNKAGINPVTKMEKGRYVTCYDSAQLISYLSKEINEEKKPEPNRMKMKDIAKKLGVRLHNLYPAQRKAKIQTADDGRYDFDTIKKAYEDYQNNKKSFPQIRKEHFDKICDENFYPASYIVKKYSISDPTLRDWAAKGSVRKRHIFYKNFKLNSYNIHDVEKMLKKKATEDLAKRRKEVEKATAMQQHNNSNAMDNEIVSKAMKSMTKSLFNDELNKRIKVTYTVEGHNFGKMGNALEYVKKLEEKEQLVKRCQEINVELDDIIKTDAVEKFPTFGNNLDKSGA